VVQIKVIHNQKSSLNRMENRQSGKIFFSSVLSIKWTREHY